MFYGKKRSSCISTNVLRVLWPLRKDARQRQADSMLCHVSRLSLVGQFGQKWETWGTHSPIPIHHTDCDRYPNKEKSLNRSDLWLNGLVV